MQLFAIAILFGCFISKAYPGHIHYGGQEEAHGYDVAGQVLQNGQVEEEQVLDDTESRGYDLAENDHNHHHIDYYVSILQNLLI